MTFNAVDLKGIRVLREYCCPFVAVMHPDHELAGHSSLDLEQCSGHRLIYQDNSGPMKLFLGEEIEAFKSENSPAVTSNSLTLLKELLLRGVGFAFYTRLGFVTELAEGRLVAVPLNCDRLNSMRLSLIAPPNAMPAVAGRTIAETLGRELDDFAEMVRG